VALGSRQDESCLNSVPLASSSVITCLEAGVNDSKAADKIILF
jgi:hypothetical protein